MVGGVPLVHLDIRFPQCLAGPLVVGVLYRDEVFPGGGGGGEVEVDFEEVFREGLVSVQHMENGPRLEVVFLDHEAEASVRHGVESFLALGSPCGPSFEYKIGGLC